MICQVGSDYTNDLTCESEFDRLAKIDYCVDPPGGSLVAAVTPQLQIKSGENLKDRQRKDAEIRVIVDFHENDILPGDDKKARELLLSRAQYHLVDSILFNVARDKTLRLVPPTTDHEQLFREAHSGPFGAHLREAKVHGELSKHYWQGRREGGFRGFRNPPVKFRLRLLGLQQDSNA